MLKLDSLDKRLLYLLDSNSSLSYSDLARALKVNPEIARYRYLRLEDGGIIEQAVADIDFFLLGFESYQILLKLQSLAETKMKHILAKVRELAYVSWIARLEGEYQLEIVVRVRNSTELAAFLGTLNSLLGDFVTRKSLAPNVDQRHSLRGYLSPRSKAKTSSPRISTFGAVALDTADRVICGALQQDSRMTHKELAYFLRSTSQGEIDLTPEALAKRRLLLEKSGTIRGHVLVLNQGKLGLMVFRVLLSMQALDDLAYEGLTDSFSAHPNCTFSTRVLGEWDMAFQFEVESSAALRAALSTLLYNYHDQVKDYAILEQVERVRFSASVLGG